RPTECISLRGSYGVSYHAAQLQETGGGILNGFVCSFCSFVLVDPFRGGWASTSQPLLVIGANPNLKPETGNSRTFGIEYSSQSLRGLEASLTYYTVDISNYISIPGFQTLVNNPSFYPGAVVRAPPTAQDQQRGYLGPIVQV